MQINTKPFINRILSLAKRKKIASNPVITALLEWLFTDGPGSTITAIHGPNGTTNATWSSGNVPAGASFSLQFDGATQFANSNSAINYNSNQVITVDFYAYSTIWTPGLQSVMLDSGNAQNGTANCWSIYLDIFGDMYCVINDSVSNQIFYSAPVPSNATWHHIKWVVNNANGTAQCYIDGAANSAVFQFGSWTTASPISTQSIYLAAKFGGGSQFFNGNFALLNIYPGDTH